MGLCLGALLMDAPVAAGEPTLAAQPTSRLLRHTNGGVVKVDRVSTLVAFQAPLDLDKVGFGAGVAYTRDYFVGKSTALGIHLALRSFPLDPLHMALGYGLTIRHYFGPRVAREKDGFYLLYGLLLQMNWVKGLSGTATGHDTLLAVGYDFSGVRWSPFIEAGYHLTQVRSFTEDTLWWPYAETHFGLRF